VPGGAVAPAMSFPDERAVGLVGVSAGRID
jgi:hypothetical protein